MKNTAPSKYSRLENIFPKENFDTKINYFRKNERCVLSKSLCINNLLVYVARYSMKFLNMLVKV